MPIRVEFYGLPRRRTDVPFCDVAVSQSRMTLAEVLRQLAGRYPALATDCVHDGALTSSCVANRGGHSFLRDPAAEIADGETLLLLSADAGG
jgi:molybdopterin converting factor small subunit